MHSQKIGKTILFIAIILTFIFSLSHYTNSSESLDDIFYVMAIGIDTGNTAKYKISVQMTNIESGATDAATKSDDESSSESSENGKESSGSSQASNYLIYTAETDSLDNCINIINGYVNKNISLSHCKLVLFSEKIAKNGVRDIIEDLINKVEIRPDCNIVISKIPANEFQNEPEPSVDKILSKYYDVASNPENGRGYSQSVKLSDFYFCLNDSFGEPFATLGITSNPKRNTESNQTFEPSNLNAQSRSLVSHPPEASVSTIGLAVFKKDQLVGTLSASQTMALQLITNQFNYCTVNIPSPFHNGETMDMYISSIKDPKVKVFINQGSPFVEIKLYITAKILSFNTNDQFTLSQENIDILKNHVSTYLKEQVYDYCDESARKLNADVAKIGKYAVKNFLTTDEWEKYNWLDNYQNSTFKVEVNVNIKSSHLLTND